MSLWARVGSFIALCAIALVPSLAQAERCDVIATLESLPLAHRDVLHGVCHLDADHARQLGRQLASAHGGDSDVTVQRLKKIIRRLVSRHVWAAAVLDEVLPQGLRAEPDTQLAAALQTAVTKPYQDDLSAYIKDTAEPETALRAFVSKSAASAALRSYMTDRLGLDPRLGIADVRLRVLLGRPGDKIFAAYSGSQPNVVTPVPFLAPILDRQAFLLVTPPNVHVSIAVTRGEQHFDWRMPVTDDGVQLLEPSWGLGCLDLDIRAERGSNVFVDGRPIDAVLDPKLADVQSLQVAAVRHEIVVLDRKQEGEERRAVLSHGFVEADALSGAACAEYNRDLTQGEMRTVIALFEVEVKPSCVAAGLDSAKVRRTAVEFLERSGRDVRDMDSWGSSMVEVDNFSRLVRDLGGEKVGAPRDRLDSTQALATGAGEYLRRGFSDILMIAAHCSQRISSPGYDYSFVVKDIDIRRLTRLPRDPVLGFSVRDVVRTSIQVTDVPHRLRSALLMAIAEPLGLPYGRLDGTTDSVAEHDYMYFGVEALIPPGEGTGKYRIGLWSRTLPSASAEHECNELLRHGAMRSQHAPEKRSWGLVTVADVEAQNASYGTVMTKKAQTTAPLVVRLTLDRVDAAGRATRISEDFRCISVTRPTTLIWADFGLFTVPGDGRGGERYQAQSILAGFDVRGVPVGLFLGYVSTQRSGTELPSWRGIDGEVADYKLDGSTAYRVNERRFVFGVQLQIGASLCELGPTFLCGLVIDRFALEQRLLAFGGVTFFNLEGAASAAEADYVRADAGVMAQSGISFQVTPVVRATLLFDYGLPQLIDALTTDAGRIGQPSFFDQFVIGGSVGLSWGWPW